MLLPTCFNLLSTRSPTPCVCCRQDAALVCGGAQAMPPAVACWRPSCSGSGILLPVLSVRECILQMHNNPTACVLLQARCGLNAWRGSSACWAYTVWPGRARWTH